MGDLLTTSGAEISDCGTYRYSLWRAWAPLLPTCVFAMLNPSTADATEDDPTIRRCIGFARREGCGRLVVVNLYSLRSTDPRVLGRHPYPNGPYAARIIAETLSAADGPVICAWGSDPAARDQAGFMLDLIRAYGKVPMCLGQNKDGQPKHPLYLRVDAPLVPLAPSDRLPSSTPPPAQRAAHGGPDTKGLELPDLSEVQRAGQAIRGDESDG